MPHRHIKTSQTGFQGVTHEDHKQLKLQRLNEDRPIDKSRYMMSWFGEIVGGKPILAHFPGPTVLYIIEGEFFVEEKANQKITKVVAGDVLHIDEATYSTWSSPTRGKAIGVSYAPTTVHPEDLAQPAIK